MAPFVFAIYRTNQIGKTKSAPVDLNIIIFLYRRKETGELKLKLTLRMGNYIGPPPFRFIYVSVFLSLENTHITTNYNLKKYAVYIYISQIKNRLDGYM